MSDFFVHDKAICETVRVGKNTRIWAFVHIMDNVIIGEDCNFGDHSFVESGVVIGDRVTVKNGVSVWNGVIIEDDVFLGPNCVLTNDLFPRSRVYHSENMVTTIKKGTSIGANATIVCGITLGEYCMVGAGSVVTKDVPPFALIVGVPGKIKGYISKQGEKLEFNQSGIAIDSNSTVYKINDSGMVNIIEERK